LITAQKKEGEKPSDKDEENEGFLPGDGRFGSVLRVLSHIIKF
jgi:hypothetical protein